MFSRNDREAMIRDGGGVPVILAGRKTLGWFDNATENLEGGLGGFRSQKLKTRTPKITVITEDAVTLRQGAECYIDTGQAPLVLDSDVRPYYTVREITPDGEGFTELVLSERNT